MPAKLPYQSGYENISEDVSLENIEKVFILHDLYACELASNIKKGIVERL